MSPHTRRHRVLAALTLAVPILVFSSPFLVTGRVVVGDDFRDYYGPHALQAQEHFRRTGELPRWNPYQFAGTPLLGSTQNNFYYPPLWLLLVLPVERAWGILIAAHLLLAAGGMYRLVRSFQLSRDAAALSGLSYGLSFCVMARISAGHLGHLITICQAPAILFLVRRAIRRPDSGTLAGLALGGALAVVGGSAQHIYELALFSALLAVRELVAVGSAGRPLRPALGVLAGAGGLAAGISAVHLLPVFEVASESTRSSIPAQIVAPFHDYDPSQLVLLTVPRFFWHPSADPWLIHEKALYLGILPLLLAALALGSGRRPPTRFFAGCAVGSLLEAMSGKLLSWLPWYGAFRIPERILWTAVLSISVLAGIGWSRVRTPREFPGLRRWVGGFAAAALLWAVFLGAVLQARQGTILFLGAALGAGVALGAAPRWALVGAAVVALDLGTAGALEIRSVPSGTAIPPPWYEPAIGSERSDYRVLDLETYKAAPVAKGFRLLRGYCHPVLASLSEFYASAWQTSLPTIDTLPSCGGLRDVSVLRDLGVRWIVSGGPPLDPDWRRVLTRPDQGTLYLDPKARPCAFLVGSAGSVRFERPGMNEIRIQVTAEKPGSVVVSESWSAGWSAESGGHAVRIGRYRGALLELPVEAGTSALVLRYAPRSWRRGRALSAAGLAVGIGLLLRRRLRRRAPAAA